MIAWNDVLTALYEDLNAHRKARRSFNAAALCGEGRTIAVERP